MLKVPHKGACECRSLGRCPQFLGSAPLLSLGWVPLCRFLFPACYRVASSMLLELQCKENIRSIQHAAGSSKISHILKLHAADLSLPCLLQGRSQHATEAPLHHSSFLSSAGCLLPRHTASGDTLRQSTHVDKGLRWMFEDTLHTDMHVLPALKRWRSWET